MVPTFRCGLVLSKTPLAITLSYLSAISAAMLQGTSA
jgi:hypothetical protein